VSGSGRGVVVVLFGVVAGLATGYFQWAKGKSDAELRRVIEVEYFNNVQAQGFIPTLEPGDITVRELKEHSEYNFDGWVKLRRRPFYVAKGIGLLSASGFFESKFTAQAQIRYVSFIPLIPSLTRPQWTCLQAEEYGRGRFFDGAEFSQVWKRGPTPEYVFDSKLNGEWSSIDQYLSPDPLIRLYGARILRREGRFGEAAQVLDRVYGFSMTEPTASMGRAYREERALLAERSQD
jgi:hypothetical protein